MSAWLAGIIFSQHNSYIRIVETVHNIEIVKMQCVLPLQPYSTQYWCSGVICIKNKINRITCPRRQLPSYGELGCIHENIITIKLI